MNEDAWEKLDTWERRDSEMIREHLNEAPIRFKESRKLRMNNYEMMGSEESNWKDSWIAPDGWKEFPQSKIIMRGWQQARITNLEENGARLREKNLLRSSESENYDENTTMNCWDTPKWKIRNVEPTMKRIWQILVKGIWLMITHSYVKLRKEF